MHTTTQAIEATVRALRDGMTAPMLKQALVADGFTPQKANTIIRWGQQYLKKRQDNSGYIPSTPMGYRKSAR